LRAHTFLLREMTILLIDDDLDDIDFFVEAIAEIDANIECVSVLNAIEALKLLDAGGVKPDYIFLDLNMPKMDGKQCLKLLKNSPVLHHIPVVLYSTSKREEDVEQAKMMGAHSFIVKPNKFTLLKKEISSVLMNS